MILVLQIVIYQKTVRIIIGIMIRNIIVLFWIVALGNSFSIKEGGKELKDNFINTSGNGVNLVSGKEMFIFPYDIKQYFKVENNVTIQTAYYLEKIVFNELESLFYFRNTSYSDN